MDRLAITSKISRLFIGVALISLVYSPLSPVPIVQAHGIVLELVTPIFERAAQRQAEAITTLDEQRQASSGQTPDARIIACESQRQTVQEAMARVYAQANYHVRQLDSVFVGVHNYYDNSSYANIEPYASLFASARSTYTTAQIEIGALSILNAELDCQNPDVAATIIAFSSSVSAVREALIAYRVSLISVVSTLKSTVTEDSR